MDKECPRMKRLSTTGTEFMANRSDVLRIMNSETRLQSSDRRDRWQGFGNSSRLPQHVNNSEPCFATTCDSTRSCCHTTCCTIIVTVLNMTCDLARVWSHFWTQKVRQRKKPREVVESARQHK